MMTLLCSLIFIGCEYEVPITSSPTRKVDEKLLGDWVSKDGKEYMKVRRLDDSIYIISYNGDLAKAFHSDLAQAPFISLQDIDSDKRQYTYLSYELEDNDKRLILKVVGTKLVPKEVKDSAQVQELLKKNLKNPDLFGDEPQLFIKQQ